jgi:hypothetical protein
LAIVTTIDEKIGDSRWFEARADKTDCMFRLWPHIIRASRQSRCSDRRAARPAIRLFSAFTLHPKSIIVQNDAPALLEII